jgi:hypothetical protein
VGDYFHESKLTRLIMFEELEDYKSQDHFFFDGKEPLSKACNAPKDGAGVYLVYRLSEGHVDLVYIGSSGKVLQDGSVKIRKGGLFDRIVNGTQFDASRSQSWKDKLEVEKIDALDIYWYVTVEDGQVDIPASIEGLILQHYFEIHDTLPEWNKEY